jgi:hypothetical protein
MRKQPISNMQLIKNRNILLVLVAIAAFTLTLYILDYVNRSNPLNNTDNPTSYLSEEKGKSWDKPREDIDYAPVAVNTQTEAPPTETDEPTSDNTATENVTQEDCIPTLEAVILRPYQYDPDLGDKAEQITGSYKATCLDPNEVMYEWHLWGRNNNYAQTLFSASADPVFSGYEPNTYNILLRVTARDLISEINTWVVVE